MPWMEPGATSRLRPSSARSLLATAQAVDLVDVAQGDHGFDGGVRLGAPRIGAPRGGAHALLVVDALRTGRVIPLAPVRTGGRLI